MARELVNLIYSDFTKCKVFTFRNQISKTCERSRVFHEIPEFGKIKIA
jgi:hypothetical protein